MHRRDTPGREILRQVAFECRIPQGGACLQPLASYDSTLVSMVIRSAQGSGDAEPFASRFCNDSDGGSRADLVPFPVLDASTAGANGTGAASAGVAAFSSGGAISRGSTGKNCACCSAHFAASPFKGLFVLYS